MSQAETLAAPGEAAEQPAAAPRTLEQTADDRLLQALGIEDDTDDTAGEPEEEATGELDAPAEEPGDADDSEEAPPEDRLKQWVGEVNANPKMFSRVPLKFHAAVHEAAVAKLAADNLAVNSEAIRIATERGQQAGRQQAELQIKLDAEVARLDSMAEDEPQEFVSWQRQYPERAAAYFAIKQGKAQPAQNQPNVYQAQAVTLFDKLNDYPEAKQRALAKAQTLPPTAEGIAQLQDFVTDELVEARVKGKATPEADKKLETRQQAQQTRKAMPKPPVGGARPPTEALSDDPMTLIHQGFEQDLKKLSA